MRVLCLDGEVLRHHGGMIVGFGCVHAVCVGYPGGCSLMDILLIMLAAVILGTILAV